MGATGIARDEGARGAGGAEQPARVMEANLDSFQKTGETAGVPTSLELQQMLRGAALRVTRPRVAVLTAVHAYPHADTDSIIGAVRNGTSRGVPPGRVRLPARAHRREGWYGGSSRPDPWPATSRGSGTTTTTSICRSCGVIADVDCAVGHAPVPDRVRRPRLRDRRGRGHLLGPVLPTVPPMSTHYLTFPETSSPGRNPDVREPPATARRVDPGESRRGRSARWLPRPARSRAAPDLRWWEPGLVAEPAQPEDPRQEPGRREPARRGVRLRRGVQDPRPRRREAGHRGGADHARRTGGRPTSVTTARS